MLYLVTRRPGGWTASSAVRLTTGDHKSTKCLVVPYHRLIRYRFLHFISDITGFIQHCLLKKNGSLMTFGLAFTTTQHDCVSGGPAAAASPCCIFYNNRSSYSSQTPKFTLITCYCVKSPCGALVQIDGTCKFPRCPRLLEWHI